MWKCADGTCIKDRWGCDGAKDCVGGEDESDDLCYGCSAWVGSTDTGSQGYFKWSSTSLPVASLEPTFVPSPTPGAGCLSFMYDKFNNHVCQMGDRRALC